MAEIGDSSDPISVDPRKERALTVDGDCVRNVPFPTLQRNTIAPHTDAETLLCFSAHAVGCVQV